MAKLICSLIASLVFVLACQTALGQTVGPSKPSYVSAKGVAPDQINIIWLGATVTQGTVTSYSIFRNGSLIGTIPHSPYIAPYHDTEQQVYQDIGVAPGSTHTYTVTALDSLGRTSPPSDAITATALMGTPALIPATRRTNWIRGVTVGIAGGIPTHRSRIIDVTQSPYNADRTGVSDATAVINSAVTNAVADDIVYLPAGKYRISSPIYLSFKSNVTIRGAGMGSTIIDCRSPNACITVRGTDSYNTRGEPVLSGIRVGSTQVTVADTSRYAVGNIAHISVKNDKAYPVISVSGFEDLRKQMVLVTAKSATTLTFTPPLLADFAPSGTSITAPNYVTAKAVGIEDLTIDGSNALPQIGIGLGGTYNSWVKNVRIVAIGNYPLSIAESLGCEIRHNIIDAANHSGTNGGGLLMGATTGCLVEDNIIVKNFPLIEINGSSMGNVFAYNYMPDGSVNINHAPHNSLNLYEGNYLAGGEFKSDGYFGGDSDETFFRNWTSGFFAFKRFSRNFNLIGNVYGSLSFGQPNIGNGNSIGYALASREIYWLDWSPKTGLGIKGTVTARESDSSATLSLSSGYDRLVSYCSYTTYCYSLSLEWPSGMRFGMNQTGRGATTVTLTGGYGSPVPPLGTEVGVWPRSEGFQELDMDVALTVIGKGNNIGGLGNPIYQALPSTQPLPNSLYLGSKPAWFGTLPWPPVNPANKGATTAESIPAGYRFFHPGEEAPGIGTTPLCTSFTYAAWGGCVGGVQSRSVTAASPAGCTEGDPLTWQSCTVDAPPHAPSSVTVSNVN